MRKGISITVTAEDRVRLDTIIRNRNSLQKHVWRARIIVLTADGEGTTALTRAVGKGKTVVWRWQERFMHEGIQGLTRDKIRPSRIPPLPAETVDRVVALTNQAPPHEATHWDRAGDGQDGGDKPLLGAAHLERPRAAAPSGALVQALQRPRLRRQAQGCRWPLCRSTGPCRGPQHRREKPNPSARPHPAWPANEEGPLRHNDPRLQAPRHHHPVCRPRHPRRQAHRALYAAPPPSGVYPLSQCHRR